MRQLRDRVDRRTKVLYDEEKHLKLVLEKGTPGDHGQETQRLINSLRERRVVTTSRELDDFLQLAMMTLSFHLLTCIRPADLRSLRLVLATYQASKKLLLLKPCFFFYSSCQVRHPTIDLQPNPRRTDAASPIGVSRVAFTSGRVIHCGDLSHHSCRSHIPITNFNTLSFLTVPIAPSTPKLLKDFASQSATAATCCEEASAPIVQLGSPEPSNREDGWSSDLGATVGTLSIESCLANLDQDTSQRILSNDLTGQIFHLLHDGLKHYQANRSEYKTLRACTSLIELSQSHFEPVQAYRALLLAISDLFDGADVTLHLRETFGDANKNRSVKLVAGVGTRFRGFLIGERYGQEGLVGAAVFSSTGPSLTGDAVQKLNSDEIQEALKEGSRLPYRRLMVGTAVNVAVPIRYFTRTIGAINIEWSDKTRVGILTPIEQDEYVEQHRPLLLRLSSYFSLVVDYFDDSRNCDLVPKATLLSDRHYIRKRQARRRFLEYYANQALESLAGTGPAPEKKQYLQNLVDNAGYQLAWERNLRILVSVREIVTGTPPSLNVLCDHGLRQGASEQINPAEPILLGEEQDSVLVACVLRGQPVFGTIDDGKVLTPDTLCTELTGLDKPIHYRSAGREPLYEVAAPIIFGSRVLGTFDFELFSVGEEYQGAPLSLQGHDLVPFLEWARAIAYCLVRLEEEGDVLQQELLNRPEAVAGYQRFHAICSLIIANLRLPVDAISSIADHSLRAILPGTRARIRADENQINLWFRHHHMGGLVIEEQPATGDDKPVPDGPAELLWDRPSTTQPDSQRQVAERFLVKFYTATQLSERFDRMASKSMLGEQLKNICGRIAAEIDVIARRGDTTAQNPQGGGPPPLFRWLDPSFLANLPPLALIKHAFEALHNALSAGLAEERATGDKDLKPDSYGWFIYRYSTRGSSAGERSSERLICGERFARWASMRTAEMVSAVQEPLEMKLEELNRPDVLQSWLREKQRTPTSIDDKVLIITEALASRTYQEPSSQPSITAWIAREKEAVAVPDLNLSPSRSYRYRAGHFFGTSVYSIVGAPIVIFDKCIGVLEILRRRESEDDFEFFKNEEIDAVKRLALVFGKHVQDHLDLLSLQQTGESAPDVARTAARVGDLVGGDTKVIVVVCGYPEDGTFISDVCGIPPREDGSGTGEGLAPLRTDDVVQWQTEVLRSERQGRITPIIFSRKGTNVADSVLVNRVAELVKWGARVVFFCNAEDEQYLLDLLPLTLRRVVVAQQDLERDERLTVGLESLATAARHHQSLGDLDLLIRRNGPWNHEHLLGELGTNSIKMGKQAPAIVARLMGQDTVRKSWIIHPANHEAPHLGETS